jgi:hypothetical protein
MFLQKKLVSTYEAARRHSPEQQRHPYRCENLKSHVDLRELSYLRTIRALFGKGTYKFKMFIIFLLE